jgi:hypothetical protein
MDVHCDCGADLHWDGFFAFYLRCTACGAVYELPEELALRKLDPGEEPDFAPYDLGEGHAGEDAGTAGGHA